MITLIVSMTVFAVLGVAMYSLFSTSRAGVAQPNDARRACYLAESGLRYALSEARNSGIGTLLGYNNKTFQVAGSPGFTLTINPPYFGIITGVTGTVNTVTVNFALGFPETFTIPLGTTLKIGSNDPQIITSPLSITSGDTLVPFTLGGPIQLNGSTVSAAFNVHPDTSQSINQGGNLTLSISDMGGLPKDNGAFYSTGTGTIYRYSSATVPGAKVVLNNVTWRGDALASFEPIDDLIFRVAVVNSSGAWNQSHKLLTDTISVP